MSDPQHDLERFVNKWRGSEGSEQSHSQSFLNELCGALGVPLPEQKLGDDPAAHAYVFERHVNIHDGDGIGRLGRIDLYREGCFLLEAKQFSAADSKKKGLARRGEPAWHQKMEDAFGQAVTYAATFDHKPPFIIVCDIGYCFDLYSNFDGAAYRPFPNAEKKRVSFAGGFLAQAKLFRSLWTDPLALDPSKHAAKVTREVAELLAHLAAALEIDGHHPERIARFLMRCLFTMFAEDVRLIPAGLFTRLLRDTFIPNPEQFPVLVEQLWRAMNEGGYLLVSGATKLLQFNGGLFRDASALKLSKDQLKILLKAAEHDWADVEPAIFGTLLERALNLKERHKLGAHYTPRAYVERLVRPTIEEPLRAEWDLIRAEVRTRIEAATGAKTKKIGDKELVKAGEAVRAFHKKLCTTRVLDPACGSGNFLYVTLDLFKRLESEVIALLRSLGDIHHGLFDGPGLSVTPAQFLGIEVKPWAKEIAELVLWIGYLQWFFRTREDDHAPIKEPVLQDYGNIECRDAVLAWDGEPEIVRDENGAPKTRWDGETMKISPVTGEKIPDETALVPAFRYKNPRKAEWPEAEFIVGNPPFIGSKRMRVALGGGYVDALRSTYQDVPDGTDFVLYWWARGAERLRSSNLRRYGFITTNSITQSMNRKATEAAIFDSKKHSVLWAIPDHPWVDSSSGAAVRIAMTVIGDAGETAQLVKVISEDGGDGEQIAVTLSAQTVGQIHSDLRSGAAVATAQPLKANAALCSVALVRFGDGFVVDAAVAEKLETGVVHPLLTGRDVNQSPSPRFVIDFFPMDEATARQTAPRAFQHVLEYVKPGRDQIRDPGSRQRWWRFGRDKPDLRAALSSVKRFIATSEVSKSRFFSFVPGDVRPDHSLIVVASDDAWLLGVLSSRIHTTWAKVTGGRMGVANDLRYNRSVCFDPFPFPVFPETHVVRIRAQGEQLDAHRKRQQLAFAPLTMTGMYNVLAKLRTGEVLSEKEKLINAQGLVSTLKKIHDDLDAAVFDAYGWPHDLTDEQILERLVALNAERAAEEKSGLVRWLRPEFQNPEGGKKGAGAVQVEMAGVATDESGDDAVAAAGGMAPWPKRLPDQLGAVRDLLYRLRGGHSVEQVAAEFAAADSGEVAAALESLAALGLVAGYEVDGGRRYRAVAR